MNFFMYNHGCDFCRRCAALCELLGGRSVDEPHLGTFAIAPRLGRRLSVSEWSAPHFGTLVFHPSALPYRRGPDSVRQAVGAKERVSAATWFWCNEGMDEGPICEQEVVVLKPGESAGRAYHTRFVPAGLRALDRAVRGVLAGRPQRRPQDHALATYESFAIA